MEMVGHLGLLFRIMDMELELGGLIHGNGVKISVLLLNLIS